MPRRDGTGPMGRGAMTGRGIGRNFVEQPTLSKTQKELLQEQKELLESKLNTINKQLEN